MNRHAHQVLELAERGPVAAEELGRRNVRRELVAELVADGLARVDSSTGDLELTPAGLALLARHREAVLQRERHPYP